MKDPWEETSMETNIPEEESDRDRVTVTAKGGPGFDAPWIVLHAKNIEEANRFMGMPADSELITSAVSFSTRFQAAYTPFKASASPSGAAASSGGYRPTPNASPAPVGAPVANCPQHGVTLVYNPPFTSGGKTISGRMSCPERGCRAITIWHNKDGSWKQQ